MRSYITNKTIYETNECGAYSEPKYNFPFANNFTFKQVYSEDENYLLFEATYNIEYDSCPNCDHISHAVKEYKYIYPIIGEINGKVKQWLKYYGR